MKYIGRTSLNIFQKHPVSSIGSELKSVIDKSWKDGVEYEKVEASAVCHDGESIQGSHVVQSIALYILQWKYNPTIVNQISHDSTTGGSAITTDMTRTSSSHKAQVLYFYEVLHSADYK